MTKKKILEPHQITGRDFLASHYHACLGDEPGLGKTVQAIHAAEKIGARRVYVTCPASVRSNWEAHVKEHFGSTWGWRIDSYEEAVKCAHTPGSDNFDLWIGDEIHFCKNLESQRTRAIFARGGMARRARYKWPMSGTLAPNGRPVELYPMLKTMCPEFKDTSFAAYGQRYCGAYWDGRSMNVKGATRIDELAKMLSNFMLRRTKREVYPDRKEPLISRVPVDLTPGDLSLVRALEDEIGGREARLSPTAEKISQLGDTSAMLHLLGLAIAPWVARFVDDLLETTDKVVVFAHHREVIQVLYGLFQNRGYRPVLYVGGMTDNAKDVCLSTFRRPEHRVFIGQRQAAGTGINGLQDVCSTAVIAEPSWVPGETEQLIDRLDRMGQKAEIVNAYIMYARETLSEAVVFNHERKDATRQRLLPASGLEEIL